MGFKVGDKVRLVHTGTDIKNKDTGYFEHSDDKGRVFSVTDSRWNSGSSCSIQLDWYFSWGPKDNNYYAEWRFELATKKTPATQKATTPKGYKFQKGDRVLVTRDDRLRLKNEPGVVVNAVDLTVKFDRNVGGHTGSGKGKDGHCWYVDTDDLTLETYPATLVDGKLPEGTRVVVTGTIDNRTFDGTVGTVIGHEYERPRVRFTKGTIGAKYDFTWYCDLDKIAVIGRKPSTVVPEVAAIKSEDIDVGDTVIVNGVQDGVIFKEDLGVVVYIHPSDMLGVEFYRTLSPPYGHDCNGHAATSNGWYVDRSMARLHKEAEAKTDKPTWIISVQKADGTFAPASTPKTYVSEEQAIHVAKAMAEKYGDKFVVFKMVGFASAPARPVPEYTPLAA